MEHCRKSKWVCIALRTAYGFYSEWKESLYRDNGHCGCDEIKRQADANEVHVAIPSHLIDNNVGLVTKGRRERRTGGNHPCNQEWTRDDPQTFGKRDRARSNQPRDCGDGQKTVHNK